MPKITQKKNIPSAFICSITLDVMDDPVFTADGHVYEKSAIERWLKKKNTSPKTGLVLEHKKLTPAFALKDLIQAWKTEHKSCTFEEFIAAVKTGEPENVEKLNYLETFLNKSNTSFTFELDSNVVADIYDEDGSLFDTHDEGGVLFIAIQNNQPAMVDYLLKSGANPNQSLLHNGETVLQLAVTNRLDNIVRLLLVHGADPNVKDFGEDEIPPILIAAEKNDLEIIKLLVNYQANIQEYSPITGSSLLHYAVQNKNVEMVNYLLALDPEMVLIKNEEDKSALDLAEDLKLPIIISILEKHILLHFGEKFSPEIVSQLIKNSFLASKHAKKNPHYVLASSLPDLKLLLQMSTQQELLAIDNMGKIVQFNTHKREVMHTLSTNKNNIKHVQVLSTGQLIMTFDYERYPELQIWNIEKKTFRALSGPSYYWCIDGTLDMVITPQDHIITTHGRWGVLIRNTDNDLLSTFGTAKSGRWCTRLALSLTSDLLAVAYDAKTDIVEIWNIKNPKQPNCIHTVKSFSGNISNMHFLDDEKLILRTHHEIFIYDLSLKAFIAQWTIENNHMLVISNKHFLISSSETVEIYRLNEPKPVFSMEVKNEKEPLCTFSPEAEIIVYQHEKLEIVELPYKLKNLLMEEVNEMQQIKNNISVLERLKLF